MQYEVMQLGLLHILVIPTAITYRNLKWNKSKVKLRFLQLKRLIYAILLVSMFDALKERLVAATVV